MQKNFLMRLLNIIRSVNKKHITNFLGLKFFNYIYVYTKICTIGENFLPWSTREAILLSVCAVT